MKTLDLLHVDGHGTLPPFRDVDDLTLFSGAVLAGLRRHG
jgi:hypothetical protein